MLQDMHSGAAGKHMSVVGKLQGKHYWCGPSSTANLPDRSCALPDYGPVHNGGACVRGSVQVGGRFCRCGEIVVGAPRAIAWVRLCVG